MSGIKSFAYLRDDMLVMGVGIEAPRRYYPFTYTIEEALEDYCECVGIYFVQVLSCYPSQNVTGVMKGEFAYLRGR